MPAFPRFSKLYPAETAVFSQAAFPRFSKLYLAERAFLAKLSELGFDKKQFGLHMAAGY